MKKILGLLALLGMISSMMLAIPASATAPVTNEATVQTVVPATLVATKGVKVKKAKAANNCVLWQMTYGPLKTLSYRGVHFNMGAKVYWNHCASTGGPVDNMKKAEYWVKGMHDDRRLWASDCGHVEEVRMNMGDFGNFNPPVKTWTCESIGKSDNAYKIYTYDPATVVVPHSSTNRCAGVYWKVVIGGAVDQTGGSKTGCLD